MTEIPIRPYTQALPVEQEVAALRAPARRVFEQRLSTLVHALTGEQPQSVEESTTLVADVVGHAPDLLWLSMSVIAAELPDVDDMSEALVRARLGGTWAALAPVLDGLVRARRFRGVEILRARTLCDVHTTAESDFLSGIQRVVRETTTRWREAHDIDFVSWTSDLRSLRHVREDDFRRLFGPVDWHERSSGIADVVVPWESTHLWVEVITDLRRTSRLQAMAQYSRNEVGLLGYDSIPVTSSATVAPGMTSHFARSVAAARHVDRVGMISESAADEFRGVMEMGAGRGGRRPVVEAVPLAVAAPEPVEADLAEARAGLVIDDVPMVLVVGSHEPRKNHLAVLHAAELLWREGVSFNLVLIGAGSWRATEYEKTLAGLVAAGRPVQSIRGLPDRLLWAAYRLAHCLVFPSLNEGYGLPVAEALAAGTPVITSDYGSMRDIAAPDGTPLGALLVDPRDDESLRDALRTVITDDEVHARLVAETRQHAFRSWDDYAGELWDFLVDGELRS